MEAKLGEKLEDFLHRRKILNELRRLTNVGQKSLVADYGDLVAFDKQLATFLLDSPREFLKSADEILEGITKIPGMRLRVKNLDKSVDIRDIRSVHLSKFIQIEGILVRASDVRPEIKMAIFRCRRCGEEIPREQVGEFLVEPLLCGNPNCTAKGKGNFDLVIESTEFRDWQSVRIQEPPAKLRGGRMPRHLDGIIRDDFVDKATPGNHLVATGVLHALQTRFQRRGRPERVLRMIFFVNHIEVLQKGVEEAELTREDEEKICELAKDPWIANKIIQSISPAMKGHEEIKEAIALQLFGANPVELPDGTRIRGDTHVLLTGDPGTAKSQILKWVGNIAPRGLYTSGVKTTGAGLTAAAVRDEVGGGWTLEAGALVIADGGLVSIDEFEKMPKEEAGAILESMESQTISVAKAGIVATLNTRTAILAATNPRGGRFDPNTPVAAQIELNPVLLSRFDLMFMMRDEPKVEDDRALAQHVVQLHAKPKKVVRPPIDSEFLRKIIIYARKKIHPKFDDEKAHKVISDFYVEWRRVATMQGRPLPITVRQLEALIRLAKSYARLRLSDRVTVEDANRAINLVRKSLEQVGIDTKTGFVDVDLIMTGVPKSQREKVLRLLDIIRELEAEYEGAVPIKKVKERAANEGISERFVDYVINKEKDQGTLYSPTQETVARVK
jgi:replicative DNA helicase Mcm